MSVHSKALSAMTMRKRLQWMLTTALVGAGAIVPGVAGAQVLPVLGGGSDGGATITTVGSTETIDLNDASRVITWDTFSVGNTLGETVVFQSTDTATAFGVLNRVITASPSQIDGLITTNGQNNIAVWLINGNGITFGATGQFNGASLVVSTADVGDVDFLDGDGIYSLAGATTAPILLTAGSGTISATNGAVVLVGQDISAGKTITATEDVALIAAQDVTLSLATGSPLAITITAGTTLATAKADANGAISGASVKLVGASQGGIASLLNVNTGGSLTANAVGGVVVLATRTDAATGVTVSSAAAQDGITVAGGGVNASDATGDVAVRSTGLATISGAATAGDRVDVTGLSTVVTGTSVSLTTAEATGGNLAITATAGNALVDAATSVGGTVNIMATGGVAGRAAGGRAAVSASGAGTNSASITATGGTAFLSTVTADDSVSITAATIDATTVSAGTSLTLNQTVGDFTFPGTGTYTWATDLSLTAAQDLLLTNLTSPGAATLTAGRDVIGSSVATTDGNISIVAARDIRGAGASRLDAVAGGAARTASVTGTTGLARLGAVSSTGATSVSNAMVDISSTAVTLTSATATGGNLSLVATAGNIAVDTASAAGGSATLTASGGIAGRLPAGRANVSASGAGANPVSLTATGGTALLGTVTADDSVSITAATIDATTVTAGTSLTLNQTAGDFTFPGGGTYSWATDLSLTAAQDLLLTNLTSPGAATLNAGRDVIGTSVATTDGNIAITAGRNIQGAGATRMAVTAGGAARTANLTGTTGTALLSTVTSTGATDVSNAVVDISDASITLTSATATNGNLTLNATAGDVRVDTASAANGDMLITATADVRGRAAAGRAGLTTTGANADLTVNAGAIAFLATPDAAANLTVKANAVDMLGGFARTGDLIADSATTAAVGNLTAGDSLAVRAGGALTGGTLAAGEDVAVQGSNTVTLGAVNVGDDIDLTANGALVAGALIANASGPDTRGVDFSGANIVFGAQAADHDFADIRAQSVSGSVTLASGSTDFAGGGDIAIDAQTSVVTGAQNARLSLGILARAANVSATGALAAGQDIGAQAATSVGLTTATAGDDIGVSAGTTVTVSSAIATGAGADTRRIDFSGPGVAFVAGEAPTRVGADIDIAANLGNATITTANANQDLRITANTGNVTLGTGDAGGIATLDNSAGPSGDISITNRLTAAGTVTIDSADDVLIAEYSGGPAGAVRSTGAGSDVIVSAVNSVYGLTGAAVMPVERGFGALSAGGNLIATGTGDIRVNSLSAGGNLTVNAAGSLTGRAAGEIGTNVSGGALFAGRDVIVTAGNSGDVARFNTVEAGRDITLTAEGIAVGTLRPTGGAGVVTLNATPGDNFYVGLLSDPNDLTVSFGGAIAPVSRIIDGPSSILFDAAFGSTNLTATAGFINVSAGTTDGVAQLGNVSAGTNATVSADGVAANSVSAGAGGNVALTANGDAALGGSLAVNTITAGGTVTLTKLLGSTATARDDLRVRQAVTAGGNVSYDSQTGTLLGDASSRMQRAGGAFSILARTGNVTQDAGLLTLQSNSDLTAAPNADTLSITSTLGSITLANSDLIGGDAIGRQSDVVLSATAAGGNITIRDVRGRRVIADAAGNFSARDLIGGVAGGAADSLALDGTLLADRQTIDIVAGGAINLSNATTTGANHHADLRSSGGAITITTAIVAGGSAIARANGNISAVLADGAEDIAFRSNAGAISIGTAIAGDDIVLNAATSLTVANATTTGVGGAGVDTRSVNLSGAGVSASFAAETATGHDINLTSGGIATISGDVSAGVSPSIAPATDDYVVTGGTGVVLGDAAARTQQAAGLVRITAATGDVTQGAGLLTLRSNSDATAAPNSDSLTIASTVGSIALGNADLVGGSVAGRASDVILNASANATIRDAYGSRLIVDAAGNFTVRDVLAGATGGAADSTALDGALLADRQSVDIVAGGAITINTVTTVGTDHHIDLRSTGSTITATNALSAGGSVIGRASGSIGAASATAAEDVAIRSNAGGITIATLSAGDDIALNAFTGVAIVDATTTGTGSDARSVDLSGGGVSAAFAAEAALVGHDINVVAGSVATVGGNVVAGMIPSVLPATDDYVVTGGTGVVLGDAAARTQQAAGLVRITATTGNVTQAAGLLTLRSNSDMTAAPNTDTLSITSTTGNIALGNADLIGGSALGRQSDIVLSTTGATGSIVIRDASGGRVIANTGAGFTGRDILAGTSGGAADSTSLDGALLADRQSVDIVAGSAISLNTATTVGADHHIDLRSNTSTIGAVSLTAGGSAIGRAQGAISVTSVSAGEDIALNSVGSTVTLTSAQAGDDITLDATGNITVGSGDALATGRSDRSVDFAGLNASLAAEPAVISGSYIRLRGGADTIVGTQLTTVAGDIVIDTTGAATLPLVTAGGSLAIRSTNLVAGTLTASEDIAALIGATATVGTANAGDDLDLTTGLALTLNQGTASGTGGNARRVTFGADVVTTAAEDITGLPTDHDRANITLVSTGGNVTVATPGTLTAQRDVRVNAATGINVTSATATERDVRMTTTDGALVLGSGSAGRDATLDKQGLTGELSAGTVLAGARNGGTGAATLTSATNIRADDVTARGGNVTLTAIDGEVTGTAGGRAVLTAALARDAGGAPVAGSDRSIAVTSGTLARLGAMTAGDNVTVLAGSSGGAARDGSIDLLATNAARGSATLTVFNDNAAAANDLLFTTISTGTFAALNTLGSNGGDITGQTIAAGTDVVLNADDSISLTSAAAGDSVAARAGAAIAATSFTAGEDVFAQAGLGLTLDSATAGDDVDLSGATVTLRTATASGARADGSSVDFSLNPPFTASEAANRTNANINISSVTGAVMVSGALSAQRNVAVSAETTASLLGNVAAGSAVGGGYTISAKTGVDLGTGNTQMATGAVTIGTTVSGNVAASGLTLRSNSDSVGTEALAVTSTGGNIALTGSALVGGSTAGRESEIRLTANNGTVSFATADGNGLAIRAGGDVVATGAINAGNAARAADPVGGFNTVDILTTGGGIALQSVEAFGANHDIVLSASGAIASPSLKATRDVRATGGSVNITTAEATGRDLLLQATTGAASVGTGTAGRDATIVGITSASATNLSAGRDLLVSGGTATLGTGNAGGTGTVTGGTATATMLTTGGALLVNATTGAATLTTGVSGANASVTGTTLGSVGSVTATGNLLVSGADAILGTGNAGGTGTVTGGTATAGTLTTGAALLVNATTGAATLTTGVSGGDGSVTGATSGSADSLTTTGNLLVSGASAVLGTGNAGGTGTVTGGTATAGSLTTGGALLVNATTGAATLTTGVSGANASVTGTTSGSAGNVMATGNLLVSGAAATLGTGNAGGTGTVTGGTASATMLTTGSALLVEATAGNASLGTGMAGGTGTVRASGNASITTGLTAANTATLEAGGAASALLIKSNTANVVVTGASVDVTTAEAATSLAATASGGNLRVGTGLAGTTAMLRTTGVGAAAGDVEVTTSLNSGGTATINSTRDAMLANVTAATGNVDVTAARAVTGVGAGAANLIATTGMNNVTGGTLARLGNVGASTSTGATIAADTVSVTDVKAGTGALSVAADAGGITIGTGQAGTTAMVQASAPTAANGTVAITTSLTSGGATTVSASGAATGGLVRSNTAGVTITGATVNFTRLESAQALSVTASGGDATIGSAIAGGATMLSARDVVRSGAVTATGQTVTVTGGDADLTGDIAANRIEVINRSTVATNSLRLGDTAPGTGGFALSQAEVNRLNAPEVVLNAGTGTGLTAQDVGIGALAFDTNTGASRIDILGTRRIDVTGAVTADGSAATRTIRFGGTAVAAGRAAIVTVAPNPAGGGGRILMSSANVELRSARVAVGQAGFLNELLLSGTGTGLATTDVAARFVSNPNSSLYNAVNGAGGVPYANPDLPIFAARKLTVQFTDYALFQNTGSPGQSKGSNLGGAVGMPLNTVVLQIDGVNPPNGSAFALFGNIDGQIESNAAFVGPLVIGISAVDRANARVNGCIIGSAGGGCLVNTISQPVLSIFDSSRADIFKTAEDFSIPFDPVVGTNNESLFGDVGTFGLEDIPLAPAPVCPDGEGANCAPAQDPGK